MSESIKERLASGRIVRILAVGALASHKFVEIAALHGGYHGVWIDEEHAALSHAQIETLALAARAAGLDSYVRVAPVNYAAVMRPFETGASGVMAAQVRTLDEVRQFVSWGRYPPHGTRGMNTGNREGDFATLSPAQLYAKAERTRWLAVQIETSEALEQVEAIAAIDGVDHLFVGPVDLSVTLGVPGEFLHPRCVAALERVGRAAATAGKSWGTLPRGAEHAAVCHQLGCRLFAFGVDLAIVHQGFKAVRATYSEYFEGEA